MWGWCLGRRGWKLVKMSLQGMNPLLMGDVSFLCWAGAVAPPEVGIVSSSRRPPRTLMDCFQTHPQAEGPQLLPLTRVVQLWKPQLGSGNGSLSPPAPQISESQLQQEPLGATSAVSRWQQWWELGKTLSWMFSGCSFLCRRFCIMKLCLKK